MADVSDAVSTSSPPLTSLTVSATATAHCFQPRVTTDPPASQISLSLASASAVANACKISLEQGDRIGNNQTIYYDAAGAFDFNATHAVLLDNNWLGITVQDSCEDNYQTIVDACMLQQFFWGGWNLVGGTNFSVSNLVYPADPLARLAATGGLATIQGSSLIDSIPGSSVASSRSTETTGSILAHRSSITSQNFSSSGFTLTSTGTTGSSPVRASSITSYGLGSAGSNSISTKSTGISPTRDIDTAGRTEKSDAPVGLTGSRSGTATSRFSGTTASGNAMTDSSGAISISLSIATKSSQ
ncbi:SMP-30 gluconolaconase LRE domain protein [Puttea exsequens]|nr:SMP-30 gluconolaconase LRE domain protein [Puttea exsequens]